MASTSLLTWILSQAEPAAADALADAAGDETTAALRLLMAAGVIIGSFVVGALIARALRMQDYSFKIGIIVFALVAGVVINVVGWPPKLGIDLSGGVVLVYEVDREATKPSWMPGAVAQLNSTLNEGGGEAVTAMPASATQIDIVVPEDFDPSAVEKAVLDLRSTADITLHSGAAPTTEDGKTTYHYTVDQQHKAVEMDKLIAAVSRRINPGGVKELTIRQYGAEQLEVIIPEVDKQEVEQVKKRISTGGLLEFRILANERDDRDILRAAQSSIGDDVYIGGKLVGRWVQMGDDFQMSPEVLGAARETETGGRQVLIRIDPYNVDGGYLSRAAGGFYQGQRVVEFSFDANGARRFGQLTRNNLPDETTGFFRHLGIVLDNEVLSAPRINSEIRERGQIEGDFTEDEVTFLVDVLNAGSLPATLRPEPISEQRTSATMGDDTIRQGSMAMIISTAAILVFMFVYYRWSGLVADIAVTLNVVITVALMILIKAAFTLPGLAGLVLTVGMAVDANVLIYERMREELERGASLRMAIRNGFSRATATIIDANLTTLITAIVLYTIGTDQIKGFAVTLILGLLVSMFTAIFVSRVIFDVAEKKRWLTQLKMMRIVGHTNYDFIRWRTPAMAASLIVIAIGLGAAASRGKELLDIDFTGGSSVQLLFAEGEQQNIGQVRAAVADLPDVAVSSMGEDDREYKIDTSEADIEKVETALRETFGDSLQTYSMSFGPLATIEGAKVETEPNAGQPADSEPEASGTDEPAAEPEPESEPAPAETEPEAQPDAESDANSDTESPDEAEPQPSDESAPSTDDTSRNDVPTSSPRRSNGRVPVSLASLRVAPAIGAAVTAQETAEEKAADEQPDTEPPAESDEPAESPQTEEPAAELPQDEQPAADAPPAAETAAEEPTSEQPATGESEPAGEAGTSPADTATATVASPSSLVGGTRVELNFPESISHETLTEMIKQQLTTMESVTVPFRLRNAEYKPGSDATYENWTLEIGLDGAQTETLLRAIQTRLAETPVFPGSNQIGGKVAGDTQLMAMYAMLASMVMIVMYVWIRFQNVVFGLAAVVALLHDVLVAIAFLAISAYLSPYLGALLVDPFKISLAVVAALLTIVGFSINDTIVTFDRIREVRGKSPELTEDMINRSVNQVLARTLLTSGTVLIASVILYVLGGPGIHAFAYTMMIGVLAGTYSSIYIAAPILLWLKRPATTRGTARSSAPTLGSKAPQAGG